MALKYGFTGRCGTRPHEGQGVYPPPMVTLRIGAESGRDSRTLSPARPEAPHLSAKCHAGGKALQTRISILADVDEPDYTPRGPHVERESSVAFLPLSRFSHRREGYGGQAGGAGPPGLDAPFDGPSRRSPTFGGAEADGAPGPPSPLRGYGAASQDSEPLATSRASRGASPQSRRIKPMAETWAPKRTERSERRSASVAK
jgi:hypothetical protein